VTVTLQTVSARFAAIHTADNNPAHLLALRHWMSRWSWGVGLALLLLIAAAAPLLVQFFHLTSPWPLLLLAVGMPLYFAQGVDRGVMQGQTRFGILSLSYQAEMWARLLFSIAFVVLGWAVAGAVAGLTLSFVATWLVGFAAYDLARLKRARQGSEPHARPVPLSRDERRRVLVYAGPVGAALVGQILINNSDILIVKHFFPAEQAGYYAALALIGRIVFFATWSVVTALFPIVAQKQQRGEPHRHLLAFALALVALISAGIIAAALFIPELLVLLLFGEAYLSIAPLLWLYAVATALYALANVVITYRLSAGAGGGSVLAVAAGVAQVGGLWLFHASLQQVVLVQIGLMALLLLALFIWDGGLWLRERKEKREQ
jgi:O-antigen/teichoic acid export membrane protein